MGHNYSKFYHQPKKTENSENVETNNEVMETVFNEVMDEIVTVNPEVEVNDEGNLEVTVNVDTRTVDEMIEDAVNALNVTDIGIVINCVKLNVRKNADKDSEVLCVIEKDAEVIIDLENSTDEFYKVCTSSGVEGYCMIKYIEIK